jgi:hypothetical protein
MQREKVRSTTAKEYDKQGAQEEERVKGRARRSLPTRREGMRHEHTAVADGSWRVRLDSARDPWAQAAPDVLLVRNRLVDDDGWLLLDGLHLADPGQLLLLLVP